MKEKIDTFYEKSVIQYEQKKKERIEAMRKEQEKKANELFETTKFQKRTRSQKNQNGPSFLARMEIYNQQHQKALQKLIEQVTKEREIKEGATFTPAINRRSLSRSPKRYFSTKSNDISMSLEKTLQFNSVNASMNLSLGYHSTQVSF